MVEQGQVFRTPHLFPISTPGQMCGLGFPTSPSLAKARLTLPDLHALGEDGGRVSRPQHLEARIGLIDLHDLGEGEGRASRLPHHDKRRKPLHISNRTARYGRYIPVCPLTSMRTARYQAVPPIGVVSVPFRYQLREKKKNREKKRENLEIQRCSPDPDLSLVASRCFAGRIFADRGEKKTTRVVQTSCRGFTGRFLLPARTYRGEETSPCVGRRNEATNEQRWKRPISMKLTKDLNVDLHLFKGQWYLYLGSLITKDQTTIKPCQKCNSLNLA
ncbi:hypothetical protein B296_00021749 [Ensete ventricosum]|uniref:Uncharacterized protein n=1 Tax=Ensete ventricosum TaxID=4639 RepID=A0A427AZL4_ENSVE|nr:hypothetical protein B296_00021749 [Ensete ventricosum]